MKYFVFLFSAPVSGDLSRNLVPLLCDSRQYPGILLSNQIGSISAPKTSYFCVFMCFKQNFEPISLKQYKFLFHCYATLVNIQHCQFYKKCFNFIKIASIFFSKTTPLPWKCEFDCLELCNVSRKLISFKYMYGKRAPLLVGPVFIYGTFCCVSVRLFSGSPLAFL